MVDDCPGWNHCPARPRAARGTFAVGPLEGLDRCGDPVLLAGRGRGVLPGPARIGFLSDDFDLLARAGSAPWLYPIEAHHYSPVIAALFKLTAQGVIGAAAWHLLALAAHGVNILLVWLILVRGLGIARPYAWVATMLFALGAPGFEAIAWAAGLGYVLVESTLLAAVYVSLVARGPRTTALLRWGTLLLQLAALAIWDWGALLLPIVATCWWFRSCRAATAATCPPLPSGEGRGEGEVGRAVDLAATPSVIPLTLTLSRRERGPSPGSPRWRRSSGRRRSRGSAGWP